MKTNMAKHDTLGQALAGDKYGGHRVSIRTSLSSLPRCAGSGGGNLENVGDFALAAGSEGRVVVMREIGVRAPI